VLGRGRAGVACASALLQRGRKVILVDPGRVLPADRAALAADFRRHPDAVGYLHRLRALRRGLARRRRARKLPFSSTYLYDEVERYLPADLQGANVARALASGGLSAVWGATVTPLAE